VFFGDHSIAGVGLAVSTEGKATDPRVKGEVITPSTARRSTVVADDDSINRCERLLLRFDSTSVAVSLWSVGERVYLALGCVCWNTTSPVNRGLQPTHLSANSVRIDFFENENWVNRERIPAVRVTCEPANPILENATFSKGGEIPLTSKNKEGGG
jgi:hypothetical protein